VRKRLVSVSAILVAILGVFIFWHTPHSAEAQLAASQGFTYTNIVGATNTPLKSSPGTFHSLVINGGTLTGVITIKDTTAADCSGGVAIATIAANQVADQRYVYNLQTLNGLCITTAAAVNATAMYR